jgi:crotonobetainyl-CoA:carnitine CoA-transferase CaiB-like acyl-CoA transferase
VGDDRRRARRARRRGSATSTRSARPYDALEARDGWVVVGTASNKLFRRLCATIGQPELASTSATSTTAAAPAIAPR